VLNFCLVVEAYQETLRVEEKLMRKRHTMSRGQGFGRGNHKEKQIEEGEGSSSTNMMLVEGEG